MRRELRSLENLLGKDGRMFIWRGWGILVLLIVFLISLAGNLLCDLLAGKGYWELHSWPFASALLVAGGLIWAVDSYLSKKPERTLVDEKTGQRVTLVHKSDFFFIRMRWWGLISAAAGVLIFITNTVPKH